VLQPGFSLPNPTFFWGAAAGQHKAVLIARLWGPFFYGGFMAISFLEGVLSVSKIPAPKTDGQKPGYLYRKAGYL
jgi:hypothetical protein